MAGSGYCDACGTALRSGEEICPGCGQVSSCTSLRVSPGTTPSPLHQRYRLLEKIGEGGFGEVYKARDRKSGKLVAIKQITLARLSPREIIDATDSYNRETTLLPRLSHKSLPRVYDHFTDPDIGILSCNISRGGRWSR